jgi:hypothetical protein
MSPTKSKNSGNRSSTFVCPECGFKAAHAMGLGRHRSSRHGVRSKRQEREANRARSSDPSVQRRYAQMEKRLAKLESQQQQLLQALSRLGRIR